MGEFCNVNKTLTREIRFPTEAGNKYSQHTCISKGSSMGTPKCSLYEQFPFIKIYKLKSYALWENGPQNNIQKTKEWAKIINVSIN